MENRGSKRLKACFDLARLAANSDNLELLHSSIERMIAAVGERIDCAHASADEWYLDIIIQDECNNIEELVGLTFVASQTFITTFRSRIVTLSAVHSQVQGRPLSFVIKPKAYEILALAPPGAGGTGASEIEEIDAIANYWKHHEEWPVRFEDKDDIIRERVWDLAKMQNNNHRRTAEIANSLGIVPSSSGNLRSASEKFGVVSPYTDLRLIRAKLYGWANGILEKSRAEIDFS